MDRGLWALASMEEDQMSGVRIPAGLQVWIEARKRFHLSYTQIQMARELGLNPKKFGSLANHGQELWKLPLPQYIEHLYFKHFGKMTPENVISIEEEVKLLTAKKQARREAKRNRQLQITADQGHSDS